MKNVNVLEQKKPVPVAKSLPLLSEANVKDIAEELWLGVEPVYLNKQPRYESSLHGISYIISQVSERQANVFMKYKPVVQRDRHQKFEDAIRDMQKNKRTSFTLLMRSGETETLGKGSACYIQIEFEAV